MIKNYLNESFDKLDVFREQIKPLTDKVFDICAEHEIPFAAYACVKNESGADGNHVMAGSIRLTGPARTPFELMAISGIMQAAPHGPAAVAAACMEAAGAIADALEAGEIPIEWHDDPNVAAEPVH